MFRLYFAIVSTVFLILEFHIILGQHLTVLVALRLAP